MTKTNTNYRAMSNTERRQSRSASRAAFRHVLAVRCPKHDAEAGRGCWSIYAHASVQRFAGACESRIIAAGYPAGWSDPRYNRGESPKRGDRHAA